jgi:predicted alpha/beta-hydrolase family hydrolase
MTDGHLLPEHSPIRISFVSVFCALAIHFLCVASVSASDVESMEIRPGGSFDVLVFQAENAKATVLMFEGAGGVFNRGGPGFMGESFKYFVNSGLNVMVMTPPADGRQFRGGMPPRFREQKAHASDIGAALDRAAVKFNVPVWLLGISMGTKSLATFAEHQPEKAAGFVFLSSSMRPPGGFKAVTDHDLSRIRGSVLAVAHEGDECRGTPPGGAREIVAAASNARASKVLLMTGGSNDGRHACGVETHHVFAGIEDEVAVEIARFVIKNSVGLPQASLPQASQSQASRRDGARVATRRAASSELTREQVKELVSDKTLTFVAPSNGQQLTFYFASDGGVQMVGALNPDRIIRKEWFINNRGWLCRKVGRQNRNHCTTVEKIGERKLLLSNPRRGLSYDATVADGRVFAR